MPFHCYRPRTSAVTDEPPATPPPPTDSASAQGSETAAPQEPPEATQAQADAGAPAYDAEKALAGLVTTYQRLDALRARERLGDLAQQLCTFFTNLTRDADFWNWLRQLQPADDKEEITRSLNDLGDFEDRQVQVLRKLKVGPPPQISTRPV